MVVWVGAQADPGGGKDRQSWAHYIIFGSIFSLQPHLSHPRRSSVGEWVRGSLGLSSPHEAVGGPESFAALCAFTPSHMLYRIIQWFWSLAADDCWTVL